MGADWLSLVAPTPTVVQGATLVGAWLLTYVIHSTVLLLTAWWLVSRRRFAWSPAARHAIWNVAIVAGWITSAAQLASPWRPVGGAWQLPEAARRAMAAVQVTQRDDAPSDLASDSPSAAATPAWHTTSPGDRALLGASAETRLRLTVVTLSRTSIAVVAWGLIALTLLGRLTLSRRRLLTSLGARRDASETVAGGALRHIAAIAGTARPVRLTMSDTLAAPAAISHDEIVVPSRVLRELTVAQQEGVLAHELAHVVRGDPRWLRLATWIECVAWFQPLNRIARRELQLCAEFAADAWAVRVTREPLRLAQALSRVAEWLAARPASPAWHMPGADGSPLVERVRRLTTPQPEESPRTLRHAHSAMLLAAAAALAVLPHVDTPPTLAGTMHRFERVDFRFSDSSFARTIAPRTADPFKPGVRLLRLGDVDVRSLPPVLRDSGLVRSGARRMLIVTARATS